jgi:hypothetical protein
MRLLKTFGLATFILLASAFIFRYAKVPENPFIVGGMTLDMEKMRQDIARIFGGRRV